MIGYMKWFRPMLKPSYGNVGKAYMHWMEGGRARVSWKMMSIDKTMFQIS